MNDQTIEAEIQAKGLTAPRVTPADIEATIASEHYFTAGQGFYGAMYLDRGLPDMSHLQPVSPLSRLTFCVLILRNGFTVTGESACASPENFDAEIGRKIARANAVEKIWPLMGYALREPLGPVLRPGAGPALRRLAPAVPERADPTVSRAKWLLLTVAEVAVWSSMLVLGLVTIRDAMK